MYTYLLLYYCMATAHTHYYSRDHKNDIALILIYVNNGLWIYQKRKESLKNTYKYYGNNI